MLSNVWPPCTSCVHTLPAAVWLMDTKMDTTRLADHKTNLLTIYWHIQTHMCICTCVYPTCIHKIVWLAEAWPIISHLFNFTRVCKMIWETSRLLLSLFRMTYWHCQGAALLATVIGQVAKYPLGYRGHVALVIPFHTVGHAVSKTANQRGRNKTWRPGTNKQKFCFWCSYFKTIATCFYKSAAKWVGFHDVISFPGKSSRFSQKIREIPIPKVVIVQQGNSHH